MRIMPTGPWSSSVSQSTTLPKDSPAHSGTEEGSIHEVYGEKPTSHLHLSVEAEDDLQPEDCANSEEHESIHEAPQDGSDRNRPAPRTEAVDNDQATPACQIPAWILPL